MSYSDFLDTLRTPFIIFVNGISDIANMLISNYFFKTIFGVLLFISLFYLLYDFFIFHIDNKIDDLKRTRDLLYDYDLKQHVRWTWNINNREFLYKMRLDDYVVNRNVQEIYGDLFLKDQKNKNKTKHMNKYPSWFNKDIKSKPLSKKEKEENQRILDNF